MGAREALIGIYKADADRTNVRMTDARAAANADYIIARLGEEGYTIVPKVAAPLARPDKEELIGKTHTSRMMQ